MKKKIIIIIILIVIYFLVLFGLSILDSQEKIVYIGNYTKVIVKKNDIIVKNSNNKLLNKKVKVFLDDEFIDAYLSSGDANIYNSYYVVDNDKNKIEFNNDEILAFSTKIDVKIHNPELGIITDEEIGKISDELGIDSKNIDSNSTKKYNIDIDNDSNTEYIYYLSIKIRDGIYNNCFIINKNDEYSEFESFKVDKNVPAIKRMSLFNFIDFNNDGVYEVVISKNDGEDLPPKYKIYSFNGSTLINNK